MAVGAHGVDRRLEQHRAIPPAKSSKAIECSIERHHRAIRPTREVHVADPRPSSTRPERVKRLGVVPSTAPGEHREHQTNGILEQRHRTIRTSGSTGGSVRLRDEVLPEKPSQQPFEAVDPTIGLLHRPDRVHERRTILVGHAVECGHGEVEQDETELRIPGDGRTDHRSEPPDLLDGERIEILGEGRRLGGANLGFIVDEEQETDRLRTDRVVHRGSNRIGNRTDERACVREMIGIGVTEPGDAPTDLIRTSYLATLRSFRRADRER